MLLKVNPEMCVRISRKVNESVHSGKAVLTGLLLVYAVQRVGN